MRIVVNDIAASSGGALSVLRDFYACVCEYDKENEWIFLLSEKFFDETENVKIIIRADIKKSPVKKILFDFFIGAHYISKLQPDIVFSMQNIITYGVKAPQIVYMHQPLPFQHIKRFSFLKKDERSAAVKQRIVGRIIKDSVKRADHVIVQTKWVKEAVCRDCGVNQEKITICRPKSQLTLKKNSNLSFNPSAFFYPTSEVLYKNNELLFKASERLTAKGYAHTVEMTIGTQYSKGNVKCIGRIPYELVVEKYQASTLAFPSYIETFGYPLAEARQMGAIILAADTPFARELLEGYENAYFFSFDNAEQLSELMEKVIKGEIVRKANNESVEESKENSWVPVMDCVLGQRKARR